MKSILVLSFLILASCASQELVRGGRPLISKSNYVDLIYDNTQKDIKYSGLYNTLEVQATPFTSQVAQGQLDYQTHIYQWDENKFSTESAAYETRLNREAEFFISFFTPEKKNDDLTKPNSVWKVFLDVDGRRYEGQVKKVHSLLAEIQGFYPYHNRFSTPYSVIFPVPMKSIESKPMTLTLTGPIAAGILKFEPNF